MQQIYINKYFLFTVGSVCCIKRFTTGSRNSQGCLKVADHAQPGHPVKTATEATVQQVEELIHTDKRITTHSVETALGCSHGLAYSIMQDHLKFRKVCEQWVLRELKDREKMNRMGLSLQHLQVLQYVDEGEDTFNRIVTGDESWMLHYQPESKHASMQWKHPSLHSTKKFKVMNKPSAGKVMLTSVLKFSGVHFVLYITLSKYKYNGLRLKKGEVKKSGPFTNLLFSKWTCNDCTPSRVHHFATR
jgi:hypothetical protein